ncbi:prepilin peptidase [Candidatus Woesearchaeota archaeon]|nr:prepilin peptidase [Candidatus Woesearchaeota archaeon]
MILDILLIIITLITLVIASITDIKTREIPDFLNYSLLIIVFFLKLLESITIKSFTPFLYAVLGFIMYFVIALFMYYTKQWGGGDSKLLMSLGIVFSQYPSFFLSYFNPSMDLPLLLSMFLNILIFGSLYGMLFSAYTAIKNKDKFLAELKKAKLKKIRYYLILSLAIVVSSLFTHIMILKLFIISISLLITLIPYLLIFIKTIEKSCMIKNIPINNLTEGDWIVNDIYSKNKIVYSKKSLGVTLDQISIIKKLKIKTITIKEGIPFTPAFLIAFIITLIYGNILFFI